MLQNLLRASRVDFLTDKFDRLASKNIAVTFKSRILVI
jgi:hypothetical protein